MRRWRRRQRAPAPSDRRRHVRQPLRKRGARPGTVPNEQSLPPGLLQVLDGVFFVLLSTHLNSSFVVLDISEDKGNPSSSSSRRRATTRAAAEAAAAAAPPTAMATTAPTTKRPTSRKALDSGLPNSIMPFNEQ